jgi:hypothetical protein
MTNEENRQAQRSPIPEAESFIDLLGTFGGSLREISAQLQATLAEMNCLPSKWMQNGSWEINRVIEDANFVPQNPVQGFVKGALPPQGLHEFNEQFRTTFIQVFAMYGNLLRYLVGIPRQIRLSVEKATLESSSEQSNQS